MTKLTLVNNNAAPSQSLTKHDAQQLINTLAMQSENVVIYHNGHAMQRQAERDFTRQDIITILREGIIREEPVFTKGSWRYKIEILGYQKRIGAAVVTLIVDHAPKIQDAEHAKKLHVVTVMWKDKR